jgi:hypothetical protein
MAVAWWSHGHTLFFYQFQITSSPFNIHLTTTTQNGIIALVDNGYGGDKFGKVIYPGYGSFIAHAGLPCLYNS